MAVIMIENDKKDNEDERKYKKSRGTTGALQPRMLLAYVFNPLLKVSVGWEEE